MGYSLAVDIGGTFTDIVLRHDSGRLIVDKTLTTPPELSMINGEFAKPSRASRSRKFRR